VRVAGVKERGYSRDPRRLDGRTRASQRSDHHREARARAAPAPARSAKAAQPVSCPPSTTINNQPKVDLPPPPTLILFEMAELATQLYGNATELVSQFIASTKPLSYDLYANTDVTKLNMFEVSSLIEGGVGVPESGVMVVLEDVAD